VKTRGGVTAALLVALLVGGCTAQTPDEQAAAAVDEARAALASATPSPSDEPSEAITVPPQPDVLTKNALYRAGRLPAAGCALPGYATISLATVRDFYTDLLRCLNKAWEPVIRSAGFAFHPPKLVVTKGKSPSSPCEFTDGLAYYCDRTIYTDAKADLSIRGVSPDVVKVWMAFDFGHEYAHHVQALTGILQAKYQRALTLNGVEAALEESRRIELQASCLSGVYLGADSAALPVTTGWRTVYRQMMANSKDPARDHGNSQNLTRWAMAGLDSANPAACNTYTVASPDVA
jgi:predicted metalloprotease